MAEYRLSLAAQRDLDRIFDDTVIEWGLAQAADYTDLIEQACA
jgi:toxin ParE1/3/4